MFTNVGIGTDNVHIIDFFPLLNSVICFCGFSSTPLQGISDIYKRIFHIGLRRQFIFKARFFTQHFSKLAPSDRNNFITSAFYFLQPRLSFHIPVQQCLLSVADGFVSIWHTSTPMPKAPQVLKDLIRLFSVPVNFHVLDPGQ